MIIPDRCALLVYLFLLCVGFVLLLAGTCIQIVVVSLWLLNTVKLACISYIQKVYPEVSTSLNVPAGIRTLLLKEVCFKLPLANDTGNNKKRFITLQNLPNVI